MLAPVGAPLLGAEWTSAARGLSGLLELPVTLACMLFVCWRTVVACLSCAVCCHRDVCLGVLRFARSRSNRLHCTQSVIWFSEPSACGLISVSFLCICLSISQ